MNVTFAARGSSPAKGNLKVPLPIKSDSGLLACCDYAKNGEHPNHVGYAVTALSFHLINDLSSFCRLAKKQRRLLESSIPELQPHKWNKEIAEHIIICPPKGIRLSNKERQEITIRTLEKLADGYACAYSWHDDGIREHCHLIILNLHKDYFWITRAASLRVLDGRGDYLPFVLSCARDIVSVLNAERSLEGRELIPSLQTIRHNKRADTATSKNHPYSPFIEGLALLLGFWAPEGDDKKLLAMIEKTITKKMDWSLSHLGSKYIKVIPPQGKKKYTMSLFFIKSEIRRLYIEHAQSFNTMEKQKLNDIALNLRTIEFAEGSDISDRIRIELEAVGHNVRATDIAIESCSPRGELYRMKTIDFANLITKRYLALMANIEISIIKKFVSKPELREILSGPSRNTIRAIANAPRDNIVTLFRDELISAGLEVRTCENGKHAIRHPASPFPVYLNIRRLYDYILEEFDRLDKNQRRKKEEKMKKEQEQRYFDKQLRDFAEYLDVIGLDNISKLEEYANLIDIKYETRNGKLRIQSIASANDVLVSEWNTWDEFHRTIYLATLEPISKQVAKEANEVKNDDITEKQQPPQRQDKEY